MADNGRFSCASLTPQLRHARIVTVYNTNN
jgi:hypothetical protein